MVRRSACRKSLAEFAPAGAKKIKSIFCRGVYVAENTSRPANVRIVRFWRIRSALQRAVAFSKKWLRHFFDSLSGGPENGPPLFTI